MVGGVNLSISTTEFLYFNDFINSTKYSDPIYIDNKPIIKPIVIDNALFILLLFSIINTILFRFYF